MGNFFKKDKKKGLYFNKLGKGKDYSQETRGIIGLHSSGKNNRKVSRLGNMLK